jgi:hypothetical protein
MIPIIRGLRMAGDAVGRSPIEYLFFGVLDFIFLLMAAESLNEPVPNYRRAVEWAIAGIASILIGYYWPKIKQRLARAKDGVKTESSPVGDAAKAIGKTGPPITLKQLFEIDWPNLPAFYHECILSGQALDAGSVKVAWRVNGDFIGRSKFLAILIDPKTKASDAFKACESIADQYGHFIDSANSEVDIEGQAPDDTAPTNLKDMVFSKRIFIYYEEFSLAQKGTLETIYQSKELSVQFRDAAYAWAHKDDKPRATPLVPNTTILPDARLTPGLKIKITKLSPGPGDLLTETKES